LAAAAGVNFGFYPPNVTEVLAAPPLVLRWAVSSVIALVLATPLAIAIADDGTKYVADDQVQSIVVFDASDRYVRSFGHKDFRPVSVAIHGNELYAANYKASRIEVFDRTSGELLRTIGTPGKKHGEMYGPLGVAVDNAGNVYVDDVINCRVQKFDASGKFVSTFGSQGDRPGAFTRPKHLAVDTDGVIYVVDAAFQNVQMFDKKYRTLPVLWQFREPPRRDGHARGNLCA